MACHQAQPQLPGYGPCDSYFVESHDDDDGVFAAAAAERERHRHLSKLRQKTMAQDLSRMTGEEYQEDVLDHMEHMEGETMPDIHSIEIQTEIQWFMRPYLLDFLLEAHHAFQLLPETLHLAVNLLDRYCSRRVVYKRHYQLVGCAALLIAAKYGDRKERVPTIRELKSMCCSLYDDDMFTQMEWHVLQTLGWVIGHPTVTGFTQLALTEVALDPELEHMTWYISEIALYHKEFIPVRPSVMAKSSIALARCVLGRSAPRFCDWSSRYDPQVVLNLSGFLTQPSPALTRKYSAPHLSSVSSTVDLFLQRQAMLAHQAAMAPANDAAWMDHHHNAASHNLQYLTPSTPQKGGYPVAPGCFGIITPPITPDKDLRANHVYDPVLNTHFPLPGLHTSTPPPSVDQQQQQQQQQRVDPVHLRYMPQPHFGV